MKKNVSLIAAVLALVLVLAGCGGAEQPRNSDQKDFLWQITLAGAELTDNLSNTQTFIMYDGSPEEVGYSKTPSEGNVFLLLNLTVTKSDVGKSTFRWEDLYVEDAAGNRYHRLENDSFLDNYDIPRLKSTDLATGTNHGCICLEVPAATRLEDLKLVHDTGEALNTIYLTAK